MRIDRNRPIEPMQGPKSIESQSNSGNDGIDVPVGSDLPSEGGRRIDLSQMKINAEKLKNGQKLPTVLKKSSEGLLEQGPYFSLRNMGNSFETVDVIRNCFEGAAKNFFKKGSK